MTNEVSAIRQAIDKTVTHIDRALDTGSRRDFVLWCRRRASLVARLESLLLSLATAPVA